MDGHCNFLRRGGGILRGKLLEEKYVSMLEFPGWVGGGGGGGGGVRGCKTNHDREYGYFLGSTQYGIQCTYAEDLVINELSCLLF